MTDDELVRLSDSFAAYYEYIEGDDTINGQTLDLIVKATRLESTEYADVDCIYIAENIIKNYHQWHKIEAERVG